MTMTLPKGRSVIATGLSATTGAGVALGFTLFDSTTTNWLLVPVAVITLVSPLLAGWLSPALKDALFFPVSVLASLSIASAIYGPLSSDSEPVGFVIVLTLIYGGGTSVAFCAAWIAKQYLRRLGGSAVPVDHLAIASLVMVCCSVALSVLFIAIPLPSLTSTLAPHWAAILAPLIGLIGVAAGSAIIWSHRNRGRWGFLGLGLSLLYLGASIAPPVFLATAHLYGPVALVLVGLATWNILKWNRGVAR